MPEGGEIANAQAPAKSVADTMDFLPDAANPVGRGTADLRDIPQPRDSATDAAIVLAVAVTALAFYQRKPLMRTVRERAALVICGGLAVMALSIFVAADHNFWEGASRLEKFLDRGWVTMFGASLTLVGLYHWIAGPPDHKI